MGRIELKVIEKQPQGVIIYRGTSMLNQKPIVVVATGLARNSKNGKTGEMVQVFILADNVKPQTAVFNGQDDAVCGDCPHRYIDGAGTCYVNPVHGPAGVMRAVVNGSYPTMTPTEAAPLLAGRVVRLGAYGDPAAVPLCVWDELLTDAAGWTGYTHQWRKAIAAGLNRYCMASVETPRQQAHAIRKGWRTFRIREDENDTLLKGEIQCPASAEAGKRLTCEDCGACAGGNVSKASVAIIAHGTNWKRARLAKMIRALKQKKRLRFAR
jgi:hypothetical protein